MLIISLVVSCRSKDKFTIITKILIDALKSVDTDDYIYFKNNNGNVYNHYGKAVSALSSYDIRNNDIYCLTKDAVNNIKNFNLKKMLFLVYDEFIIDEFKHKKMMKMLENHEIELHLFDYKTQSEDIKNIIIKARNED